MELTKKLILWCLVVVGVSIICLAWRPISGDVPWSAAIQHGELVLVAVTLTASAVGYAAMASVTGTLDLVKTLVIGLGILELVLSIGVYASFSDPAPAAVHSPSSVSSTSYLLLAASLVIGAASTYVTHSAD